MLGSANNPVSWSFWIASGVGFAALLILAAYAAAAVLRRRLHRGSMPAAKAPGQFRLGDKSGPIMQAVPVRDLKPTAVWVG